jgi:7-cyano-7-deazaguanine synthase in queuosine biosynthesis
MLNFNLLQPDAPIGVMTSGGADSSLLVALLMKYHRYPIHVISVAHNTTSYTEPRHALKVLTHCVGKFERRDVSFYSHYVDDKKPWNVVPHEYVDQRVEYLYWGFTKQPPEGAFTEFDDTNVAATNGFDDGITKPLEWESPRATHVLFGDKMLEEPGNYKIITPFINVNKKTIAELYRQEDLEEIYPMTRSCESLTLKEGHCGKCWWCKEREWAFGYID